MWGSAVSAAFETFVKELERYLKADYGIEVKWDEAARKDPQGSVPKMALVVQTKQHGSVTRRIVVDARTIRCEQEVCLPRAHRGAAGRRRHSGEDMESWVVSADFSDAYVHWRADPRERPHCYTVHHKEGWLLQWLFFCFVLKAAPLVGRLSAAAARMLQGLLPSRRFRSQVRLDDPLWLLVGRPRPREELLSLLLLTARALRVKSGVAHGRLGPRGGHFQVALKRRVRVPSKTINEILSGVASEVRSLAGRLSWTAGVVPRLRCEGNTVYAVVTAVVKDVIEGVEEPRRRNRKDTRDKAAFVTTKRCAVALRWVACSLTHFLGGLRREACLKPLQS